MTTNGKPESYGVFDIGSNSVRALVYSGEKTLFKGLVTTRLGEGENDKGEITPEASERTINGIKKLLVGVVSCSPDKIFAFATEAVRSAKNGDEFVRKVKAETGLTVDVMDGETEGETGLSGAVGKGDGGIIDIGGASAEIAVKKDGKRIYCHSLPLGAVRLRDLCGEDESKLEELINGRIGEYGNVPAADYFAVGGTATSLCACFLRLETYDPDKVNGTVLTCGQVEDVYREIKNRTITERINELKINEKRAEIIVGGVYLLKKIMSTFGIEKITVSENDNMLGYLRMKGLAE